MFSVAAVFSAAVFSAAAVFSVAALFSVADFFHSKIQEPYRDTGQRFAHSVPPKHLTPEEDIALTS